MTTNTISPLVAKFKQLQIEGYCVLENIADNALLERTRACAEQAVATANPEKLARTRSPGTLIDSDTYPQLSGIIGNPMALLALKKLGLSDCKFWKAVIISKPPGGPRLYWHQDCLM